VLYRLAVVVALASLACSRREFADDAGTDAPHETGFCCAFEGDGKCCAGGGGWVPTAESPGEGCPITQFCGHPFTVSYDEHGCASVTFDFGKPCPEDAGAETAPDGARD